MTEQNKVEEKTNLPRDQRFLRTALTFIAALLVLLDASLWYFDDQPIKYVVMVLLLPVFFAVYIAYLGKTSQAIWISAISMWGAQIAMIFLDPETPQKIDVLFGRYLFPLIFLVPITMISMRNKLQRRAIIGLTVFMSIATAILGYMNDPSGPGVADETEAVFVTVVIGVSAIGLLYLFIRNFSEIIQGFNRISLRYKLVGAMLFLIVPSVIIAGLVTANYASNQLEAQAQALLGEVNSGLTETTNLWLADNVSFLNAMSEFPSITSMDPAEQKPVLESFDRANPSVFLVHTTDTKGINVARNDDGALQDYSDRLWYQGPMAGNDITFQSLISRTIGKPALALSVPVEDRGETVGVLQMTLEFTELTDTVGAVEIGETGNSYIVDTTNTLIAHSDPAFFNADELVDFSTDPAVVALRNGERGIYHYFDENNVSKMAYLAELEEYGWGVVVSVDEAQIQAPVVEMRARTTRVVAFTVVPTAILIWVLVSLTVNELITMTTVTEEYASGNYAARVHVRTEDEIGQLGSAFNRMAEEVGNQTLVLAERAREMEASQRVTFAASERTTPDDFLDLLVNLIVDQFDVYHSQIYMVDEENKNAVLSKSTGYAGRVLLQRHHQIPLERESLVTRCIATGEPVLVGNTVAEEGWLANELLPYTQSELVVPITVEDKVIGALDIQAREANRFTGETVPVFESMIEQVAFLYQNNTLLENIEAAQNQQQQFVKQLETASQVAGELTSILDPTQLLDQAVSMLQSNFNFYHAHIYLLDPTGEKLVVQSGSGHVGVILKERGHSIQVDAEKSFVAGAFRNRTPVRVNDTTQDPNWLPNPLLPDTRSELAVPLITRGQVIGVLDIQAEETGRFTEVDEDTMLTLAGQLATSVDTARLFVDVEHNAERDRVRFEIAEALSGNLTVDEVWNVLQERALNDHVSIVFSKAERLPDGDKLLTIVRAKSGTSKLSPAPMGYELKFSENPAFVNRVGFGDFSIINDIHTDPAMQADPQFYEDVRVQGVNSIMSAWLGDSVENVIGFMAIQSPELNYFDEATASRYHSLIELGTVALRSALLRASIARSAAETAIRLEVTEALAGNLTEDEILDVLVEKAALYQDARISLYYEDFDAPVRTIEVQRDEPFKSGMNPLGKGYRVTNDVMDFSNALQLDKPSIFANVHTDDRLDETTKAVMKQIGYTSLATFPMNMAEDWTGYIFVSAKAENYFDDEKQALYDILAEVGENALRAARLRSAVARAAQLTSIRLEVSQALTGNPSEDEVLDVLVEKMGTIEESAVGIYYEDLTKGVRTIVSMAGNAYKSGTELLPPGTVLVDDEVQFASILPLNSNLVIDNLEADETIPSTLKGLLASLKIVSLASFPMKVTDELAAHLFLASKNENFYNQEIVTLGNIVAESGEVALRAARLRDQVSKNAERDRIRFEIAEALSGNLSMDEVWDVLLEKSLDENIAVSLSEVRVRPDGEKELISVRSESTNPGLKTSPIGMSMTFEEYKMMSIQTGGFEVINDIREHEDVKNNPKVAKLLEDQGVVGMMSAWFGESEDDLMGVISISSTEAGYFNEERAWVYQSVVEIGTDALQAARLREEREAERKRFEALVTYAPDAILLLDYETYMWMDANKNAEAMFGMTREELLKTGPAALSPAYQPDGRETGEKAVALISDAVAGGSQQFEWVHKDANGREFDCEIRLALLPGTDKQLLVNITDITDRKQAQQAIVQGDRLKSEFLANMSHELRTPLNSILGYTDVLLMGLDGDLEDDVRIDLEAIHENSQHLLRLINDILDLAKIEAGRMTLSLGDVSIPMMLDELKRNNAGLLVGKDVDLVVDTPEDIPTIVADERRIYQVINNLVSNAAKFTEKGAITMRAFEDKGEMVLQVEDTGMGINKENLEAIFEEFTQVDTSSTRQHEGTGLGLTITRRLVHMHGGQIGVESEFGKGSVFSVRLPMKAKVDPEYLSVATSTNGSNGNTKKKVKK